MTKHSKRPMSMHCSPNLQPPGPWPRGLRLAGLWLASLWLALAIPCVAMASELRPFLLGGIQTHELDHERWMSALHRSGMNTVQVTVYAHQGPWNTAKLWYAEEEPAVLEEIRAARRNGLQVVLVLRVALDHNEPENRHLWHGLIFPETEAATREWFTIYTAFVEKWAKIAEREGVEVLGVASEMNSLGATLPVDELPGLAQWYLDDESQQRLRTLVGRSEHLFTEELRVSMGAGDFESLDDFLVQRNAAERRWARVYTFADRDGVAAADRDGVAAADRDGVAAADRDGRIAAMNQRRRFLDDQWRGLVQATRKVFSGRLTLAANFDNYHEVGFWDTLDLMGINAYFPLRRTLDTPLSEDGLADSWRQIFDDVETFSAKHGFDLDVIFTELGYTRWRGVTVAPWSSQGFIPLWDPEGEEDNDRAFFWENQPLEPPERGLALAALHRVWREDPSRLAGVLYWKLSSVLDLQRFEPFMLHLGESADDPSLASLQGFAEGIRPLGLFHPGDNPHRQAVDAILRNDLQALIALGPEALTTHGHPPPLHLAVRLGHRDIVRHLVASGAPLDGRDHGAFLPLHWACHSGDADLVDLLVPPVGTSWRDGAGETPLMKCVRLDHVAGVRRLLAQGDRVDAQNVNVRNVNARNIVGQSALHLAADQSSVEVVDALLAAEADIDVFDDLGKTPLHVAAQRGAADVVRALARGARRIPDSEGRRPVAEAALYGRAEAFRLLFDPESARQPLSSGETLLHLAAFGGDPQILGTILPHFPDVNPLDANGWPPLAYATHKGHSEAAELLLRHGASLDLLNREGSSVLHLAASSREPRLIQLFLRHGEERSQDFDLDLADGDGNTALHHAAGWGRLENLRLLLAAGADPSLRNKEGDTPLDIAEDSGRRRAALVLRAP